MSLQKAPTAARDVSSHSEAHWHTMTGKEVLSLVSATRDGLTTSAVEARRRTYGRNAFTEFTRETLLDRLVDQFKSPLVFVLVIAAVVTFALHEYVDAGVIAFALLIAVVVGLIQEGKASRAFEKLSQSQEHHAFVFRDGGKKQVDSAELVPGDIVELQSGMQVPADVRILTCKNLSINEAPLTGEWLAVTKASEPVEVGTAFAEQSSMAWKGTFVAQGRGIGVVVATGDRTAVGVLAQGVQDVVEERTPLQMEMERVSRLMLYLILVLVCLIFVIGVMQGQQLEEMLLMAIAIAVASVPEGLPAAVTIILAVGMEALLNRGGLVRNLLAAETLGSTTYVLTDKTGTLTEGKMALTGVIVEGAIKNDPDDWHEDEVIHDLVNIAHGASDAFYDEDADVVRGDPVEAAIFSTAKRLGHVDSETSYYNQRLDMLPFTSEQRFAAGLAKNDAGNVLCVNGAPDLVLARATHSLTRDGIQVLTDEDRTRYEDAIARETSQGKRLVGTAFKQFVGDDIPNDGTGVAEALVFAGVLVFTDPARAGVKDAIEGVKSAGAEILLITGDNPQTALSIAQQVGIVHEGAQAVTGKELTELSDEAIEALLYKDGVRVFARVLPQQKLRIAQILQKRGEIVAMTGDGINDAPALRKANIGIAIGSGTEVAKESSDLVLVNDTFATIYAAIEEGRRIISNLRKIVGYLLSTSLSEVVLIGAALLTGAGSPLTAVQILWANVIEEGFMGVAFAFEKGEKNAMKHKPQDIHAEGILSTSMMWFTAFVMVVSSMVTLSLYSFLRLTGTPEEIINSTMFLAIAVDSLFIAFSYRSLMTPVWNIPLTTNLYFVFSFIGSALLLVAALSFPLTRDFLSYTPLPVSLITTVVSLSALTLLCIEFGKWVFFERQK